MSDPASLSEWKRLSWRTAGIGLVVLIAVVFVAGEFAGWPFLAAPMQRWLGDALDRKVAFGTVPPASSTTLSTATIHLLGGIHVAADSIEIGAPTWSKTTHMLLARDAKLTLG